MILKWRGVMGDHLAYFFFFFLFTYLLLGYYIVNKFLFLIMYDYLVVFLFLFGILDSWILRHLQKHR